MKMTWKNAGLVFRGGTKEARELAGKRVRATRDLNGALTYTAGIGKPGTFDIPKLAEGLIGYDVPPGQLDAILLVFPTVAGTKLTSLTQAARMETTSVVVNWPTFRTAFEIDA
jgi:hypothetical protein